MSSPEHLIWIDLEMTGLAPDSDVIIEIATVVTTAQLDVVAEGPVIAIHQDEATLEYEVAIARHAEERLRAERVRVARAVQDRRTDRKTRA